MKTIEPFLKMGSHGKLSRWFPSHHRHPSSSSEPENPNPNSLSSAMDSPPKELLCPISGRLMADPVIVLSGISFERNCIAACKSLNVVPPGAPSIDLTIPNINLRSAIATWCDSNGVDRPHPIDLATALLFVRDLPIATDQEPAPPNPLSRRGSTRSIDDHARSATPGRPPPDQAPSPLFRRGSTRSIDDHARSAIPDRPPLDQETPPLSRRSSTRSIDDQTRSTTGDSNAAWKILSGLNSPQVGEQEAALLSLRSATRVDDQHQRSALCDEQILQSLSDMIRSKYPSLCLHAVAAVVNLSLHQPNRVRIVRAGLIPPLIDCLKNNGIPEAQDHAVAAIFSLAAEEDNKAAIGVLGALPPLMSLFGRQQSEERTRDAGMAIYYLSGSAANVSKLLKLGAVRTLLGYAESGDRGRGGVSLMILGNLAGAREGREAMIEAGAVQMLTGVLRKAAAEGSAEVEHCVAALYGMSKARLRFKGIAQSAGLEEVVREIDRGEDFERDEGMKKRRFKEMVRKLVRVCGGEEDDGGSGSWGSGGDTGGSGEFVGNFSEPILRRHPHSGNAHAAYTTRF